MANDATVLFWPASHHANPDSATTIPQIRRVFISVYLVRKPCI